MLGFMGLCNLDLDPVWVSITMWSFKYLIKYIPLSTRSQPLQRYLVIVQFLVQWGLRPAAVFRQTLETCSAWWFFFFSVYFYTVMITEGSHFSSFIGKKNPKMESCTYHLLIVGSIWCLRLWLDTPSTWSEHAAPWKLCLDLLGAVRLSSPF